MGKSHLLCLCFDRLGATPLCMSRSAASLRASQVRREWHAEGLRNRRHRNGAGVWAFRTEAALNPQNRKSLNSTPKIQALHYTPWLVGSHFGSCSKLCILPSGRHVPCKGLRFIYQIGIHMKGVIGPLLLRVVWSLRSFVSTMAGPELLALV